MLEGVTQKAQSVQGAYPMELGEVHRAVGVYNHWTGVVHWTALVEWTTGFIPRLIFDTIPNIGGLFV